MFTAHLSVVHFSDVGMNILEPQQITDTHVVVDVPHLSAFGLVWDFIIRFLNKPISGQVLLFHRPMRSRKLNVFLLPENIPLQEVIISFHFKISYYNDKIILLSLNLVIVNILPVLIEYFM